MYRSYSTTRLSDEFFSNNPSLSSSSSPNPKPPPSSASAASDHHHDLDSEHLPLFNPQSSFTKKDKARFRSAENAVHLIPLLLLVSFFVLWLFSGSDPSISAMKA